MPALVVVPHLDRAPFRAVEAAEIADVAEARGDGRVIHLAGDAMLEVGGLAAGMKSGKPSVAFCFPLPDGRVVIAETSLALFLAAADGLKSAHGDPR